ncbi:formylglycine-generating enzyme family protein [Yinghuangia aomiensis]
MQGADWRHPEGPGSRVDDRGNHPVVHVSWTRRGRIRALGGEADAHRGRVGVRRPRRPGTGPLPLGRRTRPGRHIPLQHPARRLPHEEHRGRRLPRHCPVDAFPPNGYGLFNMSGNVWEWCADWWTTDHPTGRPVVNPCGPRTGSARVIRGGSHMCHDSYCNRYRVAARTANTPGQRQRPHRLPPRAGRSDRRRGSGRPHFGDVRPPIQGPSGQGCATSPAVRRMPLCG